MDRISAAHAFLELLEHRRADEARARRVGVAVAHLRLLLDEEAIRHDQVQLFPDERHGDVQQRQQQDAAARILDEGGGDDCRFIQ